VRVPENFLKRELNLRKWLLVLEVHPVFTGMIVTGYSSATEMDVF
jgi:hypothetical protein